MGMAGGDGRNPAGRGGAAARVVPILILALLGAWGAAASAQTPGLDAARTALARGDRDAARSTLDSLLAKPDALEPRARTAAQLLRADLDEDGTDYETRLRELADADLSDADRSRVQLALGQIAYLRGDLTYALRAFRDAAAGGGGNEAASLWVGLASAALGDGAAAREALEPLTGSKDRAIRQRALLAVGDTYRAAERWSEARGAYRKLRQEKDVGPGWQAAATLDEAECLENLDDAGDAKDLLVELLQKFPTSYAAPVARSRLARMGEAAAAAETPVPAEGKGGYAVQLGAFGVSENANGLLAKLKAMGAPEARVERGEDGLYRVLLGRFADRDQAESVGDSLSTQLGLGFSVVRTR